MLSPLFLANENDAARPKRNNPLKNNQPSPPSAENFSLHVRIASKKGTPERCIRLMTAPKYRNSGTSAAANGSTYHLSRLKRIIATISIGVAKNSTLYVRAIAPPRLVVGNNSAVQ